MINAKTVMKQITENIADNENSTTRISVYDKSGNLINLQDWNLTIELSLNSKKKLLSIITSCIEKLLAVEFAVSYRIDYV